MDKNSAISLLNGMFGVVQEHEAKMELYKYYQNIVFKKDELFENGLRKTGFHEAAVQNATESRKSRRRWLYFLIALAAGIIAVAVTSSIEGNANLDYLYMMTAFYAIGALFQIGALGKNYPFSTGSLILNAIVALFAIAGAVSARPIALLPGGIMIGVSALMPLVASRIIQFNAKEKAIIEEAKNTDEEIEAANQKHLEDTAALVLAAERRLKPLENECMALRKKIQDAIPNNADRVWISVEDHQRLIMALESGRADTLEEAMEYSSKINKMQFDQRMKEINRNFNHFMDTMRMKDVEEQKRRELERAKSGEEKSKAELSETRRLINEMRSKYNVN